PMLNPAGVVIDSSDREQSFSCLTKSGENYYVGYIQLDDENNPYYSVKVAEVSLSGQVLWRRTLADSARNQATGDRQRLRLSPSSGGGVIAYWQEYRSDSNNGAQIYAQKIDSLGNALWTNGGVRVGASLQDQAYADAIQSGNHYWFVWKDVRDGGIAQIYCQRVSESGTLLWQGGHRVFTDPYVQIDPKVVAGRNGTVYLFWTQYFYNSELEDSRKFPIGVHLDENGLNADSLTWNGTNGIGVLSSYKGSIASAVPDGYGGAIIGISRLRTHFEENLVVAVQRIYDRTCVDVQEQVSEALPNEYTLEQNFPNPFNGETKFRFTLPVSGVVKVTIFDVMGREVVMPIHRQLQAGTFDVRWNGKSNTGTKVGSGVYFYRIEAGKYISTRKMVMVQ
ncbi:MAG: T9SS type A sorting domain-containing protein, partial [bacterium]|nr:T9SS type A sorting domain-containing protein [bacterium]